MRHMKASKTCSVSGLWPLPRKTRNKTLSQGLLFSPCFFLELSSDHKQLDPQGNRGPHGCFEGQLCQVLNWTVPQTAWQVKASKEMQSAHPRGLGAWYGTEHRQRGRRQTNTRNFFYRKEWVSVAGTGAALHSLFMMLPPESWSFITSGGIRNFKDLKHRASKVLAAYKAMPSVAGACGCVLTWRHPHPDMLLFLIQSLVFRWPIEDALQCVLQLNSMLYCRLPWEMVVLWQRILRNVSWDCGLHQFQSCSSFHMPLLLFSSPLC